MIITPILMLIIVLLMLNSNGSNPSGGSALPKEHLHVRNEIIFDENDNPFCHRESIVSLSSDDPMDSDKVEFKVEDHTLHDFKKVGMYSDDEIQQIKDRLRNDKNYKMY